MIYPLLPVFLSSVLGANASFIGAIEGAAQSVAALLKLAIGWWSDKVQKRKPLVVAGYFIAAAVRPFVALAQSATFVFGIRIVDRIGKGIRSAPRDALLADSTALEARGKAFGFHAAMDNAGAVLGPLMAFVLLSRFDLTLRNIFWLAAIPGTLALIVLVVAVKDVERSGQADRTRDLSEPRKLGRRFWSYLLVFFLFTLGNSTDAFLLLRANELGVGIALAPILWALLNLVKALLGTWGGSLSDRIGRRPLIIAGWITYAGVYLGFARATVQWHAWGLMASYGLFYALTEGTEKAMVADLVPVSRRGAAFGWYNLAIGIGALPASLLFGAIWDRSGSSAAFHFGALIAFASAVLLSFLPKPQPQTGLL